MGKGVHIMCQDNENKVDVTVKVDVSKIVRNVGIAGV